MSSKRIAWIDALKGMAIILVVVGHVILGYLETDLYPEHRTFLHNIFNFIYCFHMPLFFAISGFLFRKAYVEGNEGQTTIRKDRYRIQLIDLLLLYVIYSVILGVFKMIFSDSVNNPVTVKDILMIWAYPIQLYWYLYVLIIFYLIFRINFIRNTKYRYIILAVLGIVSAVSAYIPATDMFQASRIMYYTFFFFLGVLLEGLLGIKEVRTAVPFLFAGSCALAVIFWKEDSSIYKTPVINTLVALGLVLGIFLFFRSVKSVEKSRLLTFCGRYDLEIYILHTYVASAGRSVFRKIGVDNIYIILIVSSILSIAVPIIISIVLKKIKLHGLAFRPYRFISGKMSREGSHG